MMRLSWVLVVGLMACDGDLHPLPDSGTDLGLDAATSLDSGLDDADTWLDAAIALDASEPADVGVEDARIEDVSPDTGVSEAGVGPCVGNQDCNDNDSMTLDVCFEGVCYFYSCDYDNDTVLDDTCGGPDCDPTNPSIPAAAEVCDNQDDDDCDGLTDAFDDECSPTNDTCSTAIDVSAGLYDASTTNANADYGHCGPDLVYRIAVPTTKEVRLVLTVPDPMLPSDRDLTFNVSLGHGCPPEEWTGCNCAGSGFCEVFPGTFETCERLDAGTYHAVVQVGDMFGGGDGYPATLDVSLTDPPIPACGMITDISRGGTYALDPTDPRWVNAFGYCGVYGTKEALYTLTTTQTTNVLLMTPGRQGEIVLLPFCDTSTTPLSYTPPQFDLLPGTYVLLKELGALSKGSGDLEVRWQSPGIGCADAVDIMNSSSITSSTSGSSYLVDRNGSGLGPEKVYRLTLTEETRVIADLIPLFSGAIVYLQRECGISATAGYTTLSPHHIDRTLMPGTYFVIVDGVAPSDAGNFVLNFTLLPQ